MLLQVVAGIFLSQASASVDQGPSNLLLGEVHGIRGNLAAVEAAVTDAASAHPVLLALELPSMGQDVFDAYWSSSAERLSASQIQSMGWCAIDDGRVSVELVDMLSKLKAADLAYPVSVKFFVEETGFGGEFQTIASRSNYGSVLRGVQLRELDIMFPEKRIVVSIGNYHGSRSVTPFPAELGGGESLRAGHVLGGAFETVMLTYDAGERIGCGLEGCGRESIGASGQHWPGFDRIQHIGTAEAVQLLSASQSCAPLEG